MAVINTGRLPKIGEKVKNIVIEEDGVTINFEGGASIYGHAYTTSREYVSYRKSEGLNIPAVVEDEASRNSNAPVNDSKMETPIGGELEVEAGQPGY